MNETSKDKSGWCIPRRILISLAILATLIAIFYAEEDWRGKRAWENCKRELEAKGVVMDWEKLIPPPVPDDQNFFKFSNKIAYSFVHSTNDAQAAFYASQPRIQLGPTASNSFPILIISNTRPIVAATISVIPPGDTLDSGGNRLVLKLNDADAPAKARQLLQNTLGRSANGSQGFKFSEFQLTNLTPAQIILQADAPPSTADLENLIGAATSTNIGRLHVESADGSGIYRVTLTDVRITAAADYLKWSDQFAPDFDDIREALKRPYARIDCDYSVPYEIQIPNFVTMRSLAQTLAQRTQCYLLLGQPEQAMNELTLLNDSCRILQAAPTGKPMTLVASMINVAIASVYVSTIAYGLEMHFWREPQIAALQEQLKNINLTPLVAESFREMPVSLTRSLETITPAALAERYYNRAMTNVWQKLSDPNYVLLTLLPRGWVYQNMKFDAELGQYWIAGFDPDNNLILPGKVENATKEVDKAIQHPRPWNIWARFAIPNFTKAVQTTAHNQTQVNEGQIACALERYHLAHGEYPESLDALIPQFIEKLPHDIIGGQPLIYRRTGDGKFLLYSVGWNETDDGGTTSDKMDQGDWVWQYPLK
ncbi:MAG: hypothetical protein WBN75_02450 [Verrucomicrobiia bacterium]